MVTAPFLQMGKFLPEHPATSTFDYLGYITYGIFGLGTKFIQDFNQ